MSTRFLTSAVAFGVLATALVTPAHAHHSFAAEFDGDRKSTRLNSSHLGISYAVFCLKKKTTTPQPFYRVETPRGRMRNLTGGLNLHTAGSGLEHTNHQRSERLLRCHTHTTKHANTD